VNKREKHVRVMEQRQLVKKTQVQMTRLVDDLVSALKNVKLYQWHGDDKKVDAAEGYLVEALEKTVNIQYAFTELSHRYNKVRRLDKAKAEKLKLFKMPYQVDVEYPFEMMEDVEGGQQQGSET
jgi:hypothetical protein